MKRRYFIGALGATTAAVGMKRARPNTPKYIFLMIGDGMGVAQIEAAERYARMKYPSRNNRLAMNRLPVRGLTITTEVAGKITDSAAAGTALACGFKTANGILGMDAGLTKSFPSVAELARDAGREIGIISSVPVDHATPAAFYAKVPKRGMYYEIDVQLAQSGFTYVAGEPMLGRKKAKDKIPPEQLLKSAGYRLVDDRRGFDALKPGDGKVLVEQSMGYALEGKQEISLADFTRKGIELLDGDSGFFMMVEGGKIDWSGHANDLAANIHETLAFDDAVKVASDFCAAHPDEALLIVTADHETGGLQVDRAIPPAMASAIDQQKMSSGHYANLVKQWKKTGTVNADEAYVQLKDAFGFANLSLDSQTRLKQAVSGEMTQTPDTEQSPELQKMYGTKNMAVTSCLHEVAAQAGARWTSYKHTDTRIATTAGGHWAKPFGGETDNTDIGKRLIELLG